jgi:hypothetical protein
MRVDDLSRIPWYMRQGLLDYVNSGVLPGGFLQAMLCNDLRGACEAADENNKHALFWYVEALYNCAPAGCWGSREAVTAWVGQKATERQVAAARLHRADALRAAGKVAMWERTGEATPEISPFLGGGE